MTRIEKYNIFQEFKNNSSRTFQKFSDDDKKNEYLRDMFSFGCAPGGRQGGVNNRLVDVFYGNRPINVKKGLDKNFHLKTEIETEYGTQLSFEMLDNGVVWICLYPASSDSFKCEEDFILLKSLRNPSKLLNKHKLYKYYKIFNYYMSVTCTEQLGSLWERFNVFLLRFCKRKCIGNVIKKSKLNLLTKKILTVLFTVGFSGFCLAFIPFFSNSNQLSNINKELKEINTKQNEIIVELKKSNLAKENEELAKITLELKDINNKLENINCKNKELEIGDN